MGLDPYGYPTEDAPSRPMGFFGRFGVTLAWLGVDLVVGVCTAGFTGLAWDSPDDPPFIGLFSSPFWGVGLAGTLAAVLFGALRLHPVLQVVLSGVAALAAGCALPVLWFAGLVVADMAGWTS